MRFLYRLVVAVAAVALGADAAMAEASRVLNGQAEPVRRGDPVVLARLDAALLPFQRSSVRTSQLIDCVVAMDPELQAAVLKGIEHPGVTEKQLGRLQFFVDMLVRRRATDDPMYNYRRAELIAKLNAGSFHV